MIKFFECKSATISANRHFYLAQLSFLFRPKCMIGFSLVWEAELVGNLLVGHLGGQQGVLDLAD
jgi:hypothetical protein